MAKNILKLKCVIDKVVRVNGKAAAQMIVTIPMAAASEIVLGETLMSLEEVQPGLFGKPGKPKGSVIRGDDTK